MHKSRVATPSRLQPNDKYQYRGDLLPATVEKIQYYFEYTGAEKMAKLVYMNLSSSGLKNNSSIVGILYVCIVVVITCMYA